MSNSYICSIDLGSSKLAGCVAKIEKGKIRDMFFHSVPCRGLNQGRITDFFQLSASLNQLLNNLKKLSLAKIHCLYLNISSYGVITKHNFAAIPLAQRGSRLVNPYDIKMVQEEAIALSNSWEEEIIESIPLSYALDDREGITNPLNLYAHKLGVDLLTISLKSADFENINHIFDKLGYEIKNIFINPLAVLKVILDKEKLNNGLYAIIDVGAQITDIGIYQDMKLLHIGNLVFGGDNLTHQIAQAMPLSFDLANQVKINGSVAFAQDSESNNKEIMVKEACGYRRISYGELNKILTATCQEFFVSLKNYLSKNIGNKRIDRIFVCGKTAFLDGFLEMMEVALGCEVKMVSFSHFSFLPSNALNSLEGLTRFLDYVNCLACVYKALESSSQKAIFILPKNLFKKAIYWVRHLYQEYF